MRNLYVWLLLLSLVLLRIVNYYNSRPVYQDGQQLRITTRVWEEPRVFENSQLIFFENLRVYLPKYPKISYGDLIVIEGKVGEGRLKNSKLLKQEEGKLLFGLRRKLIDFYQKSLPRPDSALVVGMVLGSRAEITDDFWENLINSGTAHVVVASGMNVSLVGGFVLSFLIGFSTRRRAAILTVLVIWLYVILSGLEAPLIRAGLMGSLVFLAQGVGRKAHTLRLLIFAALIMLLVKPQWTVDLGFILSFAATASLIFFESKVDRLLYFVPKSFKIFKNGLSTSLAAQIGVAPILYLSFGRFNLMSPLINALVIWTTAYITIIGMVAGIAGLLFPLIGKLVLFLVYPLTRWFVLVIQMFG